jgi:transcriptional regulator with XRE-family HTH domain
MTKFGDFIKDLRIIKGLTLREFCRILDLDPSNWSKIERNIMPPPKSKQVLQEIARILKLKEGSEEWNTLFDLALISHIPPELIDDQSVVDKLPVFFRTIRGEKPTRKELEELIKILQKE